MASQTIDTLTFDTIQKNPWCLCIFYISRPCATGGALMPEKCFWYLIWYVWEDSEWDYGDKPIEEHLSVPLPDGDSAGIQQVSVHVAMETLGMFTYPTGNCDAQLDKMRNRVKTWTQKIQNSYLSQRSVWMSFSLQLWIMGRGQVWHGSNICKSGRIRGCTG